MKTETPETRLEAANELIKVIASCGRKFFRDGETIAHLERDQRGRIWFHDYYTGKRIYTHSKGRWKGFTSGGTLRRMVEILRDFVVRGDRLWAPCFQPTMGNGFENPWGYGDDILIVKQSAIDLGIALEPCTDYYVVSVNNTQRREKWITLWRPNNAGYCRSLLSAGKYSEECIREKLSYYNSGVNTVAVPCRMLDAIATPEAGIVPEGPILAIKNNATNWKKILRAVIEKPQYEPQPEYRGAPKCRRSA